MQSVNVCRVCGRTIQSEFVYCPWCGISQTDGQADFREKLNPAVFDQLEQMQGAHCRRRIDRIGRTLEELEKELSVMVLQSELAK